MSDTSAFPSDLAGHEQPAPSRRTIDAATRAFHWLLALCFTGAYLTADGERWRLVHVSLGYTMIGLIAFRLVWGLLGPRHARLSHWGSRLKAAPQFMRALREGRPSLVMAQNVLNALAVLSLMALVVLTTASGYVSYEELTGDWMEEVHETMGNGLLVIVLAHIGLLIGASVLRGRNLLMPMVTGKTEGKGPDLVKRNHALLATVMLAAVLGFWAWQWSQAPAGGDPGTSTSAGGQSDHRAHNGKHIDDDDD
jgi:cytochrome b